MIAVSLAFHIYRETGRGRQRRELLKRTVRGSAELEVELTRLLNPPKMSEETRRTGRNFRQQEQRMRMRKQREKAKSREWLMSNYSVLRDVSIALKGQCWQAQYRQAPS